MKNLQKENIQQCSVSATQVTKNTSLLFISRIIDIVFTLITIPLLARYLGINNYGDFSFIMAFVVCIIPVASFGIEFILVREIAKNKDIASELVASSLIARVATLIIVMILVSIFLYFANFSHRISLAIIIAIFFENIKLVAQIFISVFRAYEKMEYEAFLVLITRCINFSLILVVIKLDLGFIAVFFTFGVAYFIENAVALVIIYKKFFRLKAGKVFHY